MALPFADAVALGDCEVVVAAPLPEAEPARTAHALAVSRCRRASDPGAALAVLEGAGGALSGYVGWQRAEAHLALGDRAAVGVD
ncbi:MAG: hypothetical protein KC621_10325, partial [Myxococcales bacterium]|nr:hypothetical protein [Myxococcales bacterium]